MSEKIQLILVAGGMGTRLGWDLPKALVPLADTPLFIRSLKAFEATGLTREAIVVCPVGYEGLFQEALDTHLSGATVKLIAGGEERYHSVQNGIAALAADTELVAIHDAARPFVQDAVIRAALDSARECGASTVATPCKDTILQGDSEHYLESTPDRNRLWACQTPQVFRRDIIVRAYAGTIPATLTDDATLVRNTGQPVRIVKGPDSNIKITTRQDLDYAAYLLEKGLD